MVNLVLQWLSTTLTHFFIFTEKQKHDRVAKWDMSLSLAQILTVLLFKLLIYARQ